MTTHFIFEDGESVLVAKAKKNAGAVPDIWFVTPSPAEMVSGLARAEEQEAYLYIIVRLNARARVIVCKDGLQWILQLRNGRNPPSWRGRSYCQTRAVLFRCLRYHAGPVDAAALPFLQALPHRIGGAS